MYDFQEMGARMKQRRKELHITQSELAERLELSNNHVSGIETGRQVPSLPKFMDICNELDVRPDYLLCGCMHSDNITQNLIDTIHLCDEKELLFVQTVVDTLLKQPNKYRINIEQI